MSVYILPRTIVEQNQQWEQFQSSRQHIEHQHKLGKVTKETKVLCRTYHFKPRTDVVDGGCHSRKVCNQGMPFKGEGKHRNHKQNNKCNQVHIGGTDNIVLHFFSFEFNLFNALRMNVRVTFLEYGLYHNQNS